MDNQTESTPSPAGILCNQKGMALILAITFLAIMSILASLLLTTSTTEIQLSGNFRTQQEAFYAADRGIEYGMVEAANGDTDVDLNTLHDQIDLPAGNPTSGLDSEATTSNLVRFLNATPPPLGSGMDASAFQSRNYLVDVTGKFPLNASNGSRTRMQAQAMRIVPK